MSGNLSAWLALLGAIFGGIALKLLDTFIMRKARSQDINKSMRDELRDEIAGLREDNEQLRRDMASLSVEVDRWRQRYYDVVEEKYNKMIKDAKDKPDGTSRTH